ncbi:MAG: tRNA pseudouridine(38-40) synthase TruA [Myxococcaceae bacterium]|nr:tRNA pseudouridine(38-40) synthase TruA [Myxococcaceae bacterium]MCI0671658.1 tRNA pseudouridine(38-40) synthase TruA [Myxococcaceae bacterium]
MPRIKLTLEYDGTDYVGWQVQPNGTAVQEVVERGLAKLLGERVPVASAGRTDAGVHALGQVACFDTERTLPLKAYVQGLNTHLPVDVAVVRAEEVEPEFDPRRWSRGKRYRYLVSNRRTRSPLRRRTHWEVFAPLDGAAMHAAGQLLLGRHDFSAFQASDCEAKHPVRELRRVSVEPRETDEWVLTVEGTAFLKHMVRNIAGTLVEVGRDRRPVGWVAEVLEARDRRKAGITAPAHGLTLVEVFYGRGLTGEPEDEE